MAPQCASCVLGSGPLILSEQDERAYRHVMLENQMQRYVLAAPDNGTEITEGMRNQQHSPIWKSCLSRRLQELWRSSPGARYCLFMTHEQTRKLLQWMCKLAPGWTLRTFLVSLTSVSICYFWDQNTNYFFDVGAGNLSKALDIFSRFFIDPLLTKPSVQREVKAVESEFSTLRHNDGWRTMQILKGLSSDEHPWHRFELGNGKTLGEDAIKAGLNLRDELLKFYDHYYSANLMRLVVLGKAGLDSLQDMVVEKFSAVPNKNVTLPSYDGKLSFGPNQVKRRLNVVPVAETRFVQLLWPTPPLQQHFRSKPAEHLIHLLRQEGQGSLISILKRKGWINTIRSFLSHSLPEWSLLALEFACTDKGMKHVNDMVMMTFQYLNMIRDEGLQEWVYEERKVLLDTKFRFESKQPAMSYVSSLSECMSQYPPELIIAGRSLIFDFVPGGIRDVLSRMVPSNVMVIVAQKCFKGKTDKVEPWFGTEYSWNPLSQELIESWETCGRNPTMRMPMANPFIATDFSLRTTPSGTSPPRLPGEAPSPPRVIRDDTRCRVWHKTDQTYMTPKLNLYARMTSPVVYESPESMVMAELMLMILMEDLRDHTSMAGQAGLGSCLFTTRVFGYNHKVAVLVKLIIDRLKGLESKLKDATGKEEQGNSAEGSGEDGVDETPGPGVNAVAAPTQDRSRIGDEILAEVSQSKAEMFSRLRDQLQKGLVAKTFNDPVSHAGQSTTDCITSGCWMDADRLAAIEGPNVTLGALVTFIPRVLEMLHVEVLVLGNATPAETMNLASIIVDGLDFRPLPARSIRPERAVDLTGPRRGVGLSGVLATAENTEYTPSKDTQVGQASSSESSERAGEGGQGLGRRHSKEEWRGKKKHDVSSLWRCPEYRRLVTCPNPEERNSAVEISFQLFSDDGARNVAVRSLFINVVKDRFFDQLRTQEQLGYVVYVGSSSYASTVLHLEFVVQSSEMSPQYLDQRVEAFLQGFRQTLISITPEAFATHVVARKQMVLKRYENSFAEASRHWRAITRDGGDFGQTKRVADMISKLTLKDLIQFYDRYLAIGAPERRKMASWAQGGGMMRSTLSSSGTGNVRVEYGSTSNGETKRELITIEDIHEFQQSMPLLPVRENSNLEGITTAAEQ